MTVYREENINIRLSDILKEMGFKATGETISKGKLPDVMVYVGGIKINIEGRFGSSSHIKKLKERCKSRIEDGICNIAVGIIYPEELREAVDDPELIEKIKKCKFKSFIIYASSIGKKELSFEEERIQDIAQRLNHLYTMIVANDLLKEQIKKVGTVLDKTSETAAESGLYFSSEVVIERLKEVLGIKGK